MFWKNFLELCQSKNMKPLQVVKKIGIAGGNITNWKNGTIPSGNNLQKIADYFGVTIDDLLSDKPNYNVFISYKSEERPKIDLRGTERLWEDSGNSVEEPDCSFNPTQEKSNPNTTELDEYEKKLIGMFRQTTIDGKLRILNAADEIKKEIEKNHFGSNSTLA